MAKTRTPRSDILAQIPAASTRELRARRTGQRAVSAQYDAASGRVMLLMTSGILFGFPARLIAALAGASDAELASVTLSPGGGALHWEALDVDLSVPGLIVSAIEPDERRRELARLAGQSTSDAKAAAARANGRKGGRPKGRTPT